MKVCFFLNKTRLNFFLCGLCNLASNLSVRKGGGQWCKYAPKFCRNCLKGGGYHFDVIIWQSNRLDGSLSFLLCCGMGGQVVSAGLHNVEGLCWDEGAVGVGDQAGVAVGVGVGVWSKGWGDAVGGVSLTLGSKVLSLGGHLGWGVGGHDGAVGVGNKAAEGAVWVSAVGVCTVGVWVSGVGVCTGVAWVVAVVAVEWSGHDTLGSKVSSLSSEDLGGLGWGHGAIGVGDQLGAGDSSRGEKSQQLHV